ncbi:hypothetical protein [Oleiharenicola sp. Vm1]|uniref:hypothetical protein n=1 Tax=Oleiharenicola sp. Vm1 TaxID=3398393 RepID=UPI0039F5903A
MNRARRPRRRKLSVKLPHLFTDAWEEKFEALIAERAADPNACHANFARWFAQQITEGQPLYSMSFEALLASVARISYSAGFSDGLRRFDKPSEELSHSDCPPACVEEPGESADRQTTGGGVTTAAAGQSEGRE